MNLEDIIGLVLAGIGFGLIIFCCIMLRKATK